MIRRLAPLAALAALLTGCPSPLPDYAPRIKDLRVNTRVLHGPGVHLADSSSRDNPLRMVANVATFGATRGFEERLDTLAHPARLSHRLNEALALEVSRNLPFQVTRDPQAPADAYLDVTVQNYGVTVYDHRPAYFEIRVEARLVFLPENKTVWRRQLTFGKAAREYLGAAEVTLVSRVASVSALDEMTDAQVEAVFDQMAADAARGLAYELQRDSVRN